MKENAENKHANLDNAVTIVSALFLLIFRMTVSLFGLWAVGAYVFIYAGLLIREFIQSRHVKNEPEEIVPGLCADAAGLPEESKSFCPDSDRDPEHEINFCQDCGRAVKDDYDFCPDCGRKLRE